MSDVPGTVTSHAVPPEPEILVALDITRAGALALLQEIDRVRFYAPVDVKGPHSSKIPALLALHERLTRALGTPPPPEEAA